jgi:aryl-alcohol dehydrogenase-like predicted oxidoreductase
MTTTTFSQSLRTLGNSDLRLTPIGFGAWAIGGGNWEFAWGAQEDSESIAAIHRALDLGVNWIDTAAIYGLGHSEEVVGQAIRGIPAGSRPLIFTKCGLTFDRAKPYEVAQRNLRPESIRRECEDSLRRLGVERIDLYQFHWADETGTPIEDSWGEMSKLVQEGKIRAAGVSNFTVALLERCERIRHVDSLQPPFSLIRRDAGGELIPWCAAHGTGVIVYSPMQAGLLTDTFEAGRVAKMATDDWRRRTGEFKEPNLSRNLALRDALRPIAARHGASVAATAVAWTLHWPGVTAAIVGARSAAQVDGWVRAGDIRLTQQDIDEITQAVERLGTGTGPSRPNPPSGLSATVQ